MGQRTHNTILQMHGTLSAFGKVLRVRHHFVLKEKINAIDRGNNLNSFILLCKEGSAVIHFNQRTGGL